MEISELKNRLNITEVATHLGIQIGKNQRANCPFHNDKTPSLQFSKEKQIATCFSSKCNLGTVDIIGLTESKLNLNTHEALKYLSALVKGTTIKAPTTIKTEKTTMNYQTDFENMQSSLISSSTARNYAESRKLNWKTLQIGYNAYKNSKFDYLRGCIVFPLKDKEDKIVSLYGRSVRDNDASTSSAQSKAKHYYTANRKGLYPHYPKPETTKLILTEAIIDAATLLQIPEIKENYEILSLYGTNGLTEEHLQTIKSLQNLKEIIFFFDGDEAGIKAIANYDKILKILRPELEISTVVTPDNEDINSLAIGHQPEIFNHLLEQRLPLLKKIEKETLRNQLFEEQNPSKPAQSASSVSHSLNVSNPFKRVLLL